MDYNTLNCKILNANDLSKTTILAKCIIYNCTVAIYLIYYVYKIFKNIKMSVMIKFLHCIFNYVEMTMKTIMSSDIYPEGYNSREEAKLDVIIPNIQKDEDEIKNVGVALCANIEVKYNKKANKVRIYEKELKQILLSENGNSKNETNDSNEEETKTEETKEESEDNNISKTMKTTTNKNMKKNENKKEKERDKKECEVKIKRKWKWNSDDVIDTTNQQSSTDKSRIDKMIINYIHCPKKRKKDSNPPPDPPSETPECRAENPKNIVDNSTNEKKSNIKVENRLDSILKKKYIVPVNSHDSSSTNKSRIDKMIINYIQFQKKRSNYPPNPPTDNHECDVGISNNVAKVENGSSLIIRIEINNHI